MTLTSTPNLQQENRENVSKKPNICLNMIVKNESHIIVRMLESVIPFIDSYCICDTGSTDDTIDQIHNYFSSVNLYGVVVHEPFQNFEYNRTFAFHLACEHAKEADYILLLDADMVLEIDPSLNIQEWKSKMTADIYYLFQGSPSSYYKNVRIVKKNPNYKYCGVTHEYFQYEKDSLVETIGKTHLFIRDVGDGGSKGEKFKRDIDLLTRALENDPKNERYLFYLANSYRDSGEIENAIETYKKRIEIGGWMEEVWYCYYSIGKCYAIMGDHHNSLLFWMNGYHYYPERLENLYEIIKHYRTTGKYSLAYSIYCLAKYAETKRKKSDDHLFLQYDVYDYKLDYEFTILSYYVNYINYDTIKTIMKVLSSQTIDASTIYNILLNYKFYCVPIHTLGEQVELVQKNVTETLNIDSRIFNTSTPSMCITPQGHLVVNIRYVNYKINEDGVHYDNQSIIATINVCVEYDKQGKLINQYIQRYNTKYDGVYVGVEDVRVFSSEKYGILFNANRGIRIGDIMVEHGVLDIKNQTLFSHLVDKKDRQPVEKNWVLFENAKKEVYAIYKWYPLTIGIIFDENPQLIDYDDDNGTKNWLTFQTKHEIITPTFFQFVRGSTNGIWVDGEIWFVVHLVCNDERRYYYHMFVTMDPESYRINRYTRLFTMEGKNIEYSLGLIYDKSIDCFFIGYSVMDRTTQFLKIKKESLNGWFF